MNNQPLISVIMPAYNVEKYISQAIESVLNQTYTNFELIILNDGSTDNTLEIIEQYAKKDVRIHFFSQTNSKQGIARNNGFKKSNGQYIYFTDSDDIIHPELLETALKIMLDNNADIVEFEYKEFFNINEIEFSYVKNINTEFIPPRKAISILKPMTQLKFFNRNLLLSAKLSFPNYFYEDNAELYRLICFAKKIVYTPQVLFYYRRRAESTIGLAIGQNSVDIIKVAHRFLQIMQELPDYKFEFQIMAHTILKNYIDAWKKMDADWAKNATLEAQTLLEQFEEEVQDNPYYFVAELTKQQYVNSTSWKITKPLRQLKKILRQLKK